MFILLTDDREIDGEHLLIEKMLTRHPHVRLHVRKPFAGQADQARWLTAFAPDLRRRMVLHDHHECAIPYGVGGVHFKEAARQGYPPDHLIALIRSYHDSNLTVSTPFHNAVDAVSQHLFDYVTLSPVFDSISKPGYEGQGYHLGEHHHPIIGLGGLTPDRVAEASRLGYDGMAVLGYVWRSKSPMDRLDEMVASYNQWFER